MVLYNCNVPLCCQIKCYSWNDKKYKPPHPNNIYSHGIPSMYKWYNVFYMLYVTCHALLFVVLSL